MFSGGKTTNDGIEIKKDGNIAEIILDRKKTYNAFNLEMVRHLATISRLWLLTTP
jgi:enoyl-CoA hydratase/carnithine racemase